MPSEIWINKETLLEFGNPNDVIVEDWEEEGRAQLLFTPFLETNEEMIAGEAMLKRAKRLGRALGQQALEQIKSFPGIVPHEHKSKVLLFPARVLQRGNLRLVPCLYPNGAGYDVDFVWLGHTSFGDGCILVRNALRENK